jgi:hypothetical protein
MPTESRNRLQRESHATEGSEFGGSRCEDQRTKGFGRKPLCERNGTLGTLGKRFRKRINVSGCKVVGETEYAEACLAAAVAGIEDYFRQFELEATVVSVLEIRIHAVDSFPELFKEVAYNAVQLATNNAGVVAV